MGRGVGVQTYRLTVLSLATHTDWFMSLGVGLLTFASLETVGIYFGLGKAPPPDLGGRWLDQPQFFNDTATTEIYTFCKDFFMLVFSS